MVVRDPQDVFRIPGYLPFWSTHTVSGLGSYVTTLALQALVLLTLHGTAADVGLLNAARWLPYLLLGIIVGALIDRRRRKPILIGTDLARAVLLGAIPVFYIAGRLNTAVLIVFVAFFGVFPFSATQWPKPPVLSSRADWSPSPARRSQFLSTPLLTCSLHSPYPEFALTKPITMKPGSRADCVLKSQRGLVGVPASSARADGDRLPRLVPLQQHARNRVHLIHSPRFASVCFPVRNHAGRSRHRRTGWQLVLDPCRTALGSRTHGHPLRCAHGCRVGGDRRCPDWAWPHLESHRHTRGVSVSVLVLVLVKSLVFRVTKRVKPADNAVAAIIASTIPIGFPSCCRCTTTHPCWSDDNASKGSVRSTPKHISAAVTAVL